MASAADQRQRQPLARAQRRKMVEGHRYFRPAQPREALALRRLPALQRAGLLVASSSIGHGRMHRHSQTGPASRQSRELFYETKRTRFRLSPAHLALTDLS